MNIVIPRYATENASDVLNDLPDQLNLLGFWGRESDGCYNYQLNLCVPGVGLSNRKPNFQMPLSPDFFQAFVAWAKEIKRKHLQFIAGGLEGSGGVRISGSVNNFSVAGAYQWPDISVSVSSSSQGLLPVVRSLDLISGQAESAVHVGHLYLSPDFTSAAKLVLEIERVDALIRGQSPEYVKALTLMPTGYVPDRVNKGYTAF